MSDNNKNESLKYGVTRVFSETAQYLKHSDANVIANWGSSRSGKTYSILQLLCFICLDPEQFLKLPPKDHETLNIVVGGKTLTWVMRNIFPDFKEILKGMGFWNSDNWNGSERVYLLNGHKLSFVGFDGKSGEEKAHGLKSDILFLNEANYINYSIFQQLKQRNTNVILIDFNPNFGIEHWIMRKVMPSPGCKLIHSTYKDNTFLKAKQVANIESYEPTPINIKRGTADDTFWKIYGLGEMGIIKGLVLPNFKEVAEMPPLADCDKRFYGLDFGFSVDETALPEIRLFNGELFIEERIYETNLTSIHNPHNPNQMSIETRMNELSISKKANIWADLARPEMIADLHGCGWMVAKADKGPGSLYAGLLNLKRYKLNITSNSYNILKEFSNYKWKEGADGNPTSEPVDKFNHAIDAIRYGCWMECRPVGMSRRMVDTFKQDAGLGFYSGY
jgi:phage terminase large subunit